jgi:hypothetical protein
MGAQLAEKVDLSSFIERIEDLKEICLKCGRTIKGDLQVIHGLHEKCYLRAFRIRENHTDARISRVSRLRSLARAGSADQVNDDSLRDPQFHGNYPKYSVWIAGSAYIAKLGRTNDYNLIALAETISNQVAKILGLKVPDFCLIYWRDRPAFIVKNFMPEDGPANLIHLQNLWPKGSDGKMTEYLLPELMKIIAKYGGYRAEKQIVELIIFDYIIGNADRHRGNIAFIQNKSRIKLSPIYDNVTDLGLEPEEFLSPDEKAHPAMRILIEGARTVDAKTYLDCLATLGYERQVKDFCSVLEKKIASILKAIEVAVYLTPNLRAAFLDLVKRRSLETIEASRSVS